MWDRERDRTVRERESSERVSRQWGREMERLEREREGEKEKRGISLCRREVYILYIIMYNRK